MPVRDDMAYALQTEGVMKTEKLSCEQGNASVTKI
jgi:hypothetical protein